MALGLGENVRNLQYFVGQSPWKTEPVMEVHQRLVAETLGEADGVALIDESGGGETRKLLGGGSSAILWFGRQDRQQSERGLPGLRQPERIQFDRRAVVHARILV